MAKEREKTINVTKGEQKLLYLTFKYHTTAVVLPADIPHATTSIAPEEMTEYTLTDNPTTTQEVI